MSFCWIFKVLMTVIEFSVAAVAKRSLLGWVLGAVNVGIHNLVLFYSKGYHG